ncbi:MULTISPECIES: helix-turn-helix domain-containing protein [Sphingobacterium]|uniref:helix-turn-helix domain-containing protein n=1 Tax=Sphingobacterium TaxID=28453 RepID=UPI002580C3AD|nr:MULTISPECIES: helix-turn-helix transcriptional regulator [Sphingobacterium]
MIIFVIIGYVLIMGQRQIIHLGQNIRDMRLLKGMKQETLGRAMGMAQQNVSKMEQKELPTEEILERAAKALGTTVEAIKKFNKEHDFNFFFGYTTNQHNHPISEVIEYFKEELLKGHGEKQELKDEIASLKAELEALKKGSSEPDDKVKNLERKAK